MAARFARLSADERKLLLRAFLLLLRIRLLLCCVPFRSLQRSLDQTPKSAAARYTPEAAAWAVAAAARRIPGTHCLARALALHGLLRRAGAEPRLHIGVRRPGKALDAHAWVTCEGRAFDDDSTIQAYAAFDPLPR